MTGRKAVAIRQGNLFQVDSPLYGRVKGERSIMDFPFFALSKSENRAPKVYDHEDIRIEIRPGATGIATMYDKEIILYVASLMTQEIQKGNEVSQDFTFTAHDYFRVTGTHTPGSGDYQRFTDALERLQATQIRTNIRTGDQQDKGWFSWLAEASANYQRKANGDEQLRVIKVRLCAWLYRAILRDGKIYDYHPDYFRLKPTEKRLYEIAHCHCDGEAIEMTIEELYAKVGTTGPINEFKRQMKTIDKENRIPDYRIELIDVIPEIPRLDARGRRIGKPCTLVVLTPRKPKRRPVELALIASKTQNVARIGAVSK
jgi:plasmid replication initiation protein